MASLILSGVCAYIYFTWPSYLRILIPFPPYAYNYWLYLSCGRLSVDFALLALMIIIVPFVTEKLRKIRDLKVALPLIVKDMGLLLAVSGLLVFSVFAFIDVFSVKPNGLDPFLLPDLFNTNVQNFNTYIRTLGSTTLYGLRALTFMSLSSIGIFIYRLDQGMLVSARKTFTQFAAPVVVIFEACLLMFAPNTMTYQVINFLLKGTLQGEILTNWLVLILASYFTLLGFARFRQWLVGSKLDRQDV